MRRALAKENRRSTEVVPQVPEELAYLVHDMRSVATSISLMVDLLELAAKAEDDSVQRARAVSAQKSCHQMALLCAEAATHLAGTTDESLAPGKFSLLELLVEAATVYSPIFDLAGKTLELNTNRRAPQFYGSRSQIFRAVSNLLDNGLKHTASGATVIIGCTESTSEYSITISDDSPGFAGLDPDERRTVASLPVVVEHMANTGNVFSPGTGLRFVSETVAMHDGVSTVELNNRGGTTFTLKFPIHPAA